MNVATTSCILSIETATPVCSVCLARPDGRVEERRQSGKGVHSEKTFVFVDELLREAGIGVQELGGILVSTGPGSFTGLRIGLSAVLGLTFGTRVPVFRVNSLASIRAMAMKQMPGAVVHSVIDARRSHVYYLPPDQPPQATSVVEIGEVAAKLKPGDVLAGTGSERFPAERLAGVDVTGETSVSARGAILLYRAAVLTEIDPDEAEPEYFQDEGTLG